MPTPAPVPKRAKAITFKARALQEKPSLYLSGKFETQATKQKRELEEIASKKAPIV